VFGDEGAGHLTFFEHERIITIIAHVGVYSNTGSMFPFWCIIHDYEIKNLFSFDQEGFIIPPSSKGFPVIINKTLNFKALINFH
jgi:hypothetical protein